MGAILDEGIGNITDALQANGFMNNTLIVLSSDVSKLSQYYTVPLLLA